MLSNENTVYIAIELSTSVWLVGTRLLGAPKSRMHRIDAGDTAALPTLVGELRMQPVKATGQARDLACCFEAGRDGFWLHRLLTKHDVPTYVVEPTSILVNRRARRAKTDRLDAEGLLRVLAAYVGGDHQICSMVRVPTPEEEDAKRPHREREHLVQERTQSLPPHLLAELDRLRRRLMLTMELIREVDADRATALTTAPDEAATQKVMALQRIRGIGKNFAAVLVREVLYRPFSSRKQLASYVGLTPMPHQSGPWTETGASVGLETRGRARSRSTSPGCGYVTSPKARWRHGSARGSARCKGAPGGSRSSPWRESC